MKRSEREPCSATAPRFASITSTGSRTGQPRRRAATIASAASPGPAQADSRTRLRPQSAAIVHEIAGALDPGAAPEVAAQHHRQEALERLGIAPVEPRIRARAQREIEIGEQAREARRDRAQDLARAAQQRRLGQQREEPDREPLDRQEGVIGRAEPAHEGGEGEPRAPSAPATSARRPRPRAPRRARSACRPAARSPPPRSWERRRAAAPPPAPRPRAAAAPAGAAGRAAAQAAAPQAAEKRLMRQAIDPKGSSSVQSLPSRT